MEKIKRIIQIGAYDEATNEWNNDEKKAYVFFEDESIAPIVLENDDVFDAYIEYSKQNGKEVETPEDLAAAIESAVTNGVTDYCNKNNADEIGAAEAALESARTKAAELAREREVSDEIPPVVPVVGTGEGESDTVEEEDYSEELADGVVAKNNTGKKIIAGVLAAGALFGAGYQVYQMIQTEKNQDIDNNEDKDIDFNTATFDELMDSMEDDDVRKIASQKAMALVETFHESTHKDNNFRLVEDGETYLDLSFEEALVLTTFASYSEPEDLHAIFGTYNITSTEAQDILESARTKLITYYMNAKEPSGIADLFANEEDRVFFQNLESSVITFNSNHAHDDNAEEMEEARATSDHIIRTVYYNYILDGAANSAEVGSLAKLLAFDAVYGGLNLTESASVEHTQFLTFEGMGVEAETRYYVENILKLNYDDLTEEEKTTYRANIIESGTELVRLLSTGETMTEDNSTKEELEASVSLTNLVDKMGICNAVNAEITEIMQALDNREAQQESAKSLQITTVNNTISATLRANGLDDLADQVDASLTTPLSQELLNQIRAASGDAAEAVENYENKMATINDENRPTMEQIIAAANRQTALLENYAGSMDDVATLVNNRRHVEEYHYTADENGYIGEDENGIPIFDSSVLDDKTKEEIDEFIKDNGVIIDEKTEEKTEEVTEDELTEEEKEEVEDQKDEIRAQIEIENTAGQGQISANQYANSSQYNFAISSVTNPHNGEVYDISGMTFANAINYITAYAENPNAYIPSAEDSQIQNAAEVAAENYLNGISAEDQDAIATAMGTSWANAREQLKDSFISGYTTQIEVEISTAISVGQQQKKDAAEAAAKLQEEIDKLNEQEQTSTEEEKTQPSEDETKDDEKVEEETKGDNSSEVEEGEEVTEEKEDEKESEETTPQPAPSEEETKEEEHDPNIGEQFEEGEILIEDAEGNKVNDVAPAETEVSQTETTEVAAPAETEVTQTETQAPVVVETTETQETETVAPAPAETQTSTQEEDDLAAAVEQAYQAALAQEAAEAEKDDSKGLRR